MRGCSSLAVARGGGRTGRLCVGKKKGNSFGHRGGSESSGKRGKFFSTTGQKKGVWGNPMERKKKTHDDRARSSSCSKRKTAPLRQEGVKESMWREKKKKSRDEGREGALVSKRGR